MLFKKKLRVAGASVMVVLTAFSLPSAETWKFGLMSDTQWKNNIDGENPNTVSVGIIRQLNKEFIKHDVKLVFQVGDLVDKYSEAAFITRAEAAQDLLDAGIGFFPLRGNHETSVSAANYMSNVFPQACGYLKTFGATNFQYPAANLECLSYSFDFQNVRFVLLDQFTRKDNTGVNANDNMVDQINWINSTLANRASGTHAFVMAHKNIIGQNHVDCLFGSSPASNITSQNTFIRSLNVNGVRYYFGGHDHMHHRSIVKSPDGNYSITQLIGSSNSYKFYIPINPSVDTRFNTPPRELPISQELFTIGYYIFTVDGPNVTAQYYAALNGCPGGTWENLVDCDLSKTPKNLEFIKRETFGYSLIGKNFVIQPNNTLTVVSDTCKSNGSVNTFASIISGINGISASVYDGRSTIQNINTGWTSCQDSDDDVESDILKLWGMANNIGSNQSDTFTLSMSYGSNISGSLTLVSKDESGNWEPAVKGNFDGTPKFVIGPFKSTYSLGTYGIDPASHTVWAVINHGGEFAVIKGSDGDLDGNGIIDNADIEIVTSLKNKPAIINPAADFDSDGNITLLDARKLVLISTR
ncbi:MAG TPA: metallophosphoesterase [Chitinispirillaceae bacterium]|nr:metallophosphoesterase [Chitinispirillaceae bacterium]